MNALKDDVAAWSSDTWRTEAVAWIDRHIISDGIARTGEVDQRRIRPWATVMTVPTSEGTIWFKAAAPETAFEVALYPILNSHAPDAVLSPLAIDCERGWMLLPDGGTHLGDIASGEALIEAMVSVLPRYAELQRSMASAVEPMLEIGVADMRPDMLPRRLDEAIAVTGQFVTEHGSEEDRATWDRIAAMRDTVSGWCARLASSPIASTLDHNDLHPWNMLVPRGGEIEEARFYDWGDAVVAHPFTSMLIPLRVMQDHLKCALDDPRMLRIRDAYLDVFSDTGSHVDLVETLELACRTGKIARAMVWNRALGMLSSQEAGEFAGAPLAWLSFLSSASYLGDQGF